jgi:hypothetical protein
MTAGHPVVDGIGAIHLEGRLIPHTWRHQAKLRTQANRPHNCAIDLLADIVYWHRPAKGHDEQSERLTSAAKKFEADRYRIDYKQWAAKNGWTDRQVRDAAAFLKKQGICKVEVENYTSPNGYTIYNAVFITPDVDVIFELNHLGDAPRKARTAVSEKPGTPPENLGPVSHKNGRHLPKKRDSLTKGSAKISQSTQQTAWARSCKEEEPETIPTPEAVVAAPSILAESTQTAPVYEQPSSDQAPTDNADIDNADDVDSALLAQVLAVGVKPESRARALVAARRPRSSSSSSTASPTASPPSPQHS